MQVVLDGAHGDEEPRGARVTLGGRSATTGAQGRATLAVTPRRALEARATRDGYTPATRRIALRAG